MLLISTILLMVFFHHIESLTTQTTETIRRCGGRVLEVNLTDLEVRAEMMHFQHDIKKMEIPNEFDARSKWPRCQSIQRVYEQGKCDGCWAYAASSVMSDRFCIATRGTFYRPISTQDLLECCDSCHGSGPGETGGCTAGYTALAFEYWKLYGIVTGNEACKPTDIQTEEGSPSLFCRNMCTNPYYEGRYSYSKTFASGFYVHVNASSGDLRQVQAEIMINGPIAGAMDVYKYMYGIKRSVVLTYKTRLKDEPRSAHAVKILGWAVKNGTPAWVIANSWGRRWCDYGFCYVRRGHNDFNIESYLMSAATARISQPVKIASFKRGNNQMASGSATPSLSLILLFLLLTTE